MVKVLASSVLAQYFDNLGDVLNGGFVDTYEGGTTTNATTWTSSTGATPHANPIVLDSAGRVPSGIWVTEGTAYKFRFRSSAGVTLDTIDNVVVGDTPAEDDDEYEVVVSYAGTPGAQGWMGGIELKRSVTFPVNFTGSGGSVITNPGATYDIDVQKNGATCGTVSIGTDGVFTFTSLSAATVVCVDGDTLDFYGPDVIGTASNIKITLVGALV